MISFFPSGKTNTPALAAVRKLLSTLLLAFGLAAIASGQILNIEKSRLDSLSGKRAYRIGLETRFNFFNQSASDQDEARFLSISNDLNGVYAPGKHAYVALGTLKYTANNSDPILNNGYAHLRANFNYKNRWSQEVFGQTQYDNFRGLKERYILGAGIRWKAVYEEDFALIIGSGPMYEREVWRQPSYSEKQGIEEVNLLKLSNYFIIRWDITDQINFNSIAYYQVGYDEAIDAARNRTSVNANINVKLSKYLSYTTALKLAYEDKPIIPINKLIYSIENGLTLSF